MVQELKRSQVQKIHKIVADKLSLPVGVYVKSKFGAYVLCNDYMAETMNLNRRQAIAGMSDHDLIISDSDSLIFRAQDQMILSNQHQQQFYNQVTYDNKTEYFSTLKKPLYDADGECIAILGISSMVDAAHYKMIESTYPDLIITAEQLTQQTIPPIFSSLSRRELDCLYLSIKGYSANQIAQYFDLSKRTVESYLDRIKLKLNCYTKQELIALAMDKGFFANYSMTPQFDYEIS